MAKNTRRKKIPEKKIPAIITSTLNGQQNKPIFLDKVNLIQFKLTIETLNNMIRWMQSG